MADFLPAFEKMLRNEGGYRLVEVAGDRGGQTYAGIARNIHPGWPGWTYLDGPSPDPQQLALLVQAFYRKEFWDRLNVSELPQPVAEALFDFAVNAGAGTAVGLAQKVAEVTVDGHLGPITLAALKAMDPALFELRYTLQKIARYAEICNENREQSRFLLGWINRSIKDLA